MFFYTFLLIGCVIAALVILQLYNAVVSVGKTVYTAILPSSKDGITNHVEEVIINTTINETRTPWGWKDHSTPSTLARTHPAPTDEQTPWGWPGNGNKIRERTPAKQPSSGADLNAYISSKRAQPKPEEKQQPTVGWPYREEKFEFAGKDYKVTHKVKPKRTNLETTGKPWGW